MYIYRSDVYPWKWQKRDQFEYHFPFDVIFPWLKTILHVHLAGQRSLETFLQKNSLENISCLRRLLIATTTSSAKKIICTLPCTLLIVWIHWDLTRLLLLFADFFLKRGQSENKMYEFFFQKKLSSFLASLPSSYPYLKKGHCSKTHFSRSRVISESWTAEWWSAAQIVWCECCVWPTWNY